MSATGTGQPAAVDLPRDLLGRPIGDLRLSVTDRCNFRCGFCMPAEHHHEFAPRSEVLSYEELTRLARLFVRLGARKLRLTGGEPLVRRDLERLVSMLAGLDRIEDLALTTNGALLAAKSEALRRAGLRRVTVSLPSLRQSTFERLTGGRGKVSAVLEGIEAAAAAGLTPIKINAVVIRGVNDDEVVELARFFRRPGFVLRFIEYMDVGTVNGWEPAAVVPAREVMARVGQELPLDPVPREHASDVALRYRYRDGGGELGAIASITEPFCGDCSRARLTADGYFHTCLFGIVGHDLKVSLRGGASDRSLLEEISAVWRRRRDRYSEERAELLAAGARPKSAGRVEMFRLGG